MLPAWGSPSPQHIGTHELPNNGSATPLRAYCPISGTSIRGPVAQWIRHRPTEPGIAGSSPAGVMQLLRSCSCGGELMRLRALRVCSHGPAAPRSGSSLRSCEHHVKPMYATVRQGAGLSPVGEASAHGAGGGRFEPHRGHAAPALMRAQLESCCSQGRGACPLVIAAEQRLPCTERIM